MSASPLAWSDPMIERAADALREGQCIVLPTDTVYGLAASLARADAIDSLFELKGRPVRVPIAVLVADVVQAEALVAFTPLARELAAKWWPGPLTLVLDGRQELADRVGSETGTIGVRVPALAEVRALASRVGPLATTSANLHGRPTPSEAGAVAESFPGVDVVIDGGTLRGDPSTVVDARGVEPIVLRQGALIV